MAWRWLLEGVVLALAKGELDEAGFSAWLKTHAVSQEEGEEG